MDAAIDSELGRIRPMANDPPTLVPERVRKLRQDLGLSQARLAEVSGVSQSTISRIELGSPHKASGENERALARALNTTVGYLMGETDEARQGEVEPHSVTVAERPASAAGGSPLETALGLAFDPKVHTAGALADVFEVLREFPQRQRSDGEMIDAARRWLASATALRASGTPVTALALLDAVTFGKSGREAGLAREAVANAEADAKLAADDEIVALSPAEVEKEKALVRRAKRGSEK